MELTKVQLQKILPSNKEIDGWLVALNAILPKYEINTKERIAAFLAQTSHESTGFTALKENLNYSADGLLKTFPKYFKDMPTALSYARQPEKIANRVYASRMGNGDEKSGDGWKYRGQGLIQLTGKANQSAFATYTKRKLEDIGTYLGTKEGAVESAAYFWSTNGLNKLADAKDILGMTKKINGGTLGLKERTDNFNNFLKILT